MKKIMFLLVAVLMLGFQAQVLGQTGQRGNPIRPYKENGYNKMEAKVFILGDGALNENYRRELLRIVNEGLLEAGETTVFTNNNLEFLIDSCVVYKPISLAPGYGNSRTYGNEINFYNDPEGFQGEVAIFSFGRCHLILYKTICMNLLQIKPDFLNQVVPTRSLFVPTPTQMETHMSFDELLVHHQMDTVFVVHLIKNQIEQPFQTPAENIFTPEKQKSWFGKNWPYLVGGAILAGGGAGFIFHGDGVWYGLGGKSNSLVIEPRTMPPGLDSNPDNGGAGLDSDSRSMGGGISGRSQKGIGFNLSIGF